MNKQPNNTDLDLHDFLKALREAAGLDQNAWVDELFSIGEENDWEIIASKPTVSRWENSKGVPNDQTQRAIITSCRNRHLLREFDSGKLKGITQKSTHILNR